MASRRSPMQPVNRTAVAALAVVGFGAAVALAGAGSIGPSRHGGSAAADTVLTTIAVLVGMAALGFAAFVGLRTRRPPPPVGEGAHPAPLFFLPSMLTPLIATLLLLLFAALVLGPCLSKQQSSQLPPIRPDRPATAAPSSAPAKAASGRPDWSVVTGFVLGAAGLVLAAAAMRSRRRPEVEPEATDLDDEIGRSLADLDSLDHDPDHRRVVIRTYARMERALGNTGVAREPWESPQEFLHRALAELGARGEAAEHLTDLFEEARFSTHPVDEAMRARAAASLRTIRAEIANHAPDVDPNVDPARTGRPT